MTTPEPVINPAHLARRSVAVLVLEHDRLERMGQPCAEPHAYPNTQANLAVTNLCQDGDHVRCWSALAGRPLARLFACRCLCHRAYRGDYQDALLAESDQAGELPANPEPWDVGEVGPTGLEAGEHADVAGYINPDGSGQGDWVEPLPAPDDELQLQRDWGYL